jgi:hypothetical protein
MVFSMYIALLEAVFVKGAGIGWSYCDFSCASDFFSFWRSSIGVVAPCEGPLSTTEHIRMAVVMVVVATAIVSRIVAVLSKDL